MKKLIPLIAFLLLGSYCYTQSINLAPHQSYAASIMDSIPNPHHNPRWAFDGDTNTIYHPQDHPVQWIAVHFQNPVDVDSLTFWYGQDPGGSTTQEIYSTEDSINWNLIETFQPYHIHGGGSYTLHLSEKLEGSEGIRIRTTVNPSWIQWKEIKVWGLYTNTCYVTVYDTVTVTVHDTIRVHDTITTHDTVTTEVFDTTFVTIHDTIPVYDSIAVSDTLIIDAVLTGIEGPDNINTLKIYPNPAREYLVINTGDYQRMNGYKIKIISQLGSTVFDAHIEQSLYEINLSTWEGKGLYYITVIDDGGNIIDTRKIILQ